MKQLSEDHAGEIFGATAVVDIWHLASVSVDYRPQHSQEVPFFLLGFSVSSDGQAASSNKSSWSLQSCKTWREMATLSGSDGPTL